MANLDELVVSLSLDPSGFAKGAAVADAATKKLQDNAIAAAESAHKAAQESAAAAQEAAKATQDYAKATGQAEKDAAKQRMEIARADAAAANLNATQKRKEAQDSAGVLGKHTKGQEDAQKKIREEDKKTSSSIQESGKKAAETYSKVRNEVAALFSTFIAARSLDQFISQTTAADAATARLSRTIDVSVNDLSALGIAAEQAGGTAAGAQGSLAGMVGELEAFSMGRGSDAVVGAIQQISTIKGGVDILHDSAGKVRAPLEQFKAALKDLKLLRDQQGGAKAELFGKAMGFDQSTIDMALKSGDVMGDLIEQNRKYAETKEDAAAAEQRSAEFAKMSAETQDAGRKILTQFTPALLDLMHAAEGLVEQFQAWATTSPELQQDIEGFTTAVEHIPEVLKEVEDDIKAVDTAVEPVVQSMGGWKVVIGGLIALKLGAWALSILSPILLLTRGIFGAAAAFTKMGMAANAAKVAAGAAGWGKTVSAAGSATAATGAGAVASAVPIVAATALAIHQQEYLSESEERLKREHAEGRQVSNTEKIVRSIPLLGEYLYPTDGSGDKPPAPPNASAGAKASATAADKATAETTAPVKTAEDESAPVPTTLREQSSILDRIASGIDRVGDIASKIADWLTGNEAAVAGATSAGTAELLPALVAPAAPARSAVLPNVRANAATHPTPETASATAAPAPEGLGALSSNFESRGNAGAIGWDKVGGWSYGLHQIAAATGAMGPFLKFMRERDPNAAGQLDAAGGEGGAKAGTAEFKAAWKGLAAAGPQFAKDQHDFIVAQYYQPLAARAQAMGLNVSGRSKALQDVVLSTAVAHGAGTNVIGKALTRLDKPAGQASDEEVIRAIYAERKTRYGSSTERVRTSVQSRYDREEALALKELQTGGKAIPTPSAASSQMAEYAKLREAATKAASALAVFGPKILHPALVATAGVGAAVAAVVHNITHATTNDNSVRAETHLHGPVNVQTQARDAREVAGGLGQHLQRYNDLASGANTAVA